ncbi:MAG: hypothetical protein R3D67_13140 [Hyphomicrobiaceae bacterium]
MSFASIEKQAAESKPRFSIATLVNDDEQYAAMIASLVAGGFDRRDTEFIAVRQAPSAFAGLNAALDVAQGETVILCHQDIRLIEDNRATLQARLAELEHTDPNWALAGNAGAEAPGRLALRITDPHGDDRHVGNLPARVVSLDENFIVMRRSAGLRFSRDLEGFHLYGADLCLHADIQGWSCWVIDFHLRHLSPGRKDQSFKLAEQRFRKKWNTALRPRWMQTPCTLLRLSGSALAAISPTRANAFAARLARRLPGARGWTGMAKPQARQF